jgi:hypothetical protein
LEEDEGVVGAFVAHIRRRLRSAFVDDGLEEEEDEGVVVFVARKREEGVAAFVTRARERRGSDCERDEGGAATAAARKGAAAAAVVRKTRKGMAAGVRERRGIGKSNMIIVGL